MKVVIAHRSGAPRVVELPQPPVGPGTVIVRVSHAALSLPDEMDFIANITGQLRPGQDGWPLGSMVSGIIDEVGDGVKRLKEGLRVAAYGSPYVYHATHLSVPSNLVVELPKKVNHEEGAFTGVGAGALHLLRSTGLVIGELLLIFGAGMMGILIAQLARAAGVIPILVDSSEVLLSRARNVGIQICLRPDDETLVRDVDRLSGGEGADSVILTRDAGKSAVALAATLVRWRGRMITTGAIKEQLPMQDIQEKEIELRAVQGAGAGQGDPRFERDGIRYPRALVRWTVRDNMQVFLDLVSERKVQISPLINDRIPLERATAAYEKLARSPGTATGVVLTV